MKIFLKSLSIIFVGILIFCSTSFGQSFKTLQDTINTYGNTSTPSFDTTCQIQNLTKSPISLSLLVIRVSIPDIGYQFSVCFGTNCFAPPQIFPWKAPANLTVNGDYTTNMVDFSIHLTPDSVPGTSMYILRFTNIADTSDYQICVLNYFTETSSVSENPSMIGNIQVYTEPSGQQVDFRLNNLQNENTDYIEIYNINGEKISSLPFEPGTQLVSYNTDKLSLGVYFFKLASQSVKPQGFVINR